MGTRITATAALPGLLLAFCCAANAAEPAKAQVTEVTYGGIKVAIDSATGKLRPMSEAESAALDRVLTNPLAAPQSRGAVNRMAMPATTAAAVATQRDIKGGGTAMKLPLSEMSHTVAFRDASGNVTVQHADGSAVPQATTQPAAEALK